MALITVSDYKIKKTVSPAESYELYQSGKLLRASRCLSEVIGYMFICMENKPYDQLFDKLKHETQAANAEIKFTVTVR